MNKKKPVLDIQYLHLASILTYKMMQHWIKSSNNIVPLPNLSNFRIKMLMRLSDNRYPNAVNAVRSSFLSMLPEPSESNERKQFCQSVTYFHRAPKSWKLTVPRFSLSNIPVNNLKLIIVDCRLLIVMFFGISKWEGVNSVDSTRQLRETFLISAT